MHARHGLALLAALTLTAPALAQRRSDEVVKATAKADKPDADGKQVVTITLDIDKEYHIYANPIGNEDLASNQTTLTLAGKGKLEKVEYPAGKVKADKVVGDYKVYKDKVTIKATVRRAAGDGEPVEFAIKLMACTDTKCLQPGTVKVKAE
ncbi:MAG: protein-disulfide reductase DsbD N-terminal domain-containing protein [Gemmataceae bacterium]